jgi:hypothetical protein
LSVQLPTRETGAGTGTGTEMDPIGEATGVAG